MKIPWKRDKSEKDVSEEAESSTDDVMAIADMDATRTGWTASGWF